MIRSTAAVVCLLISVSVSAGNNTKLEVQTGDHSDSNEAQAQLQKIQRQAEHMSYGSCWTTALKMLRSGCRQMTDETQRRIAYAFARCHLMASGRKISECPDEKPFLECTESDVLSDLGYTTYTEFFTHSQQICFHLQSQAWHEETERTIDRLADNSKEVSVQLEQSSNVAKEIVTQQKQTQELLHENEERLKISLQRSVSDVQKSHAETKQIISEQRALFHEVFDRVAVLQKTILGEFTSIYTFGFYVGSTVLAYIITSTSYTNGARIWLFLLLIMNAVVERSITHYHISELDGDLELSAGVLGSIIPELIHERIWLCRKIFCGLGLLILVVSIYCFKDYNKINNSLLNEIKLQNQQLQDYIRENIENTQYPLAAQNEDENAGKLILFNKMQQSVFAPHEGSVVSAQNSTLVVTVNNESDTSFHPSEMADSEASSILSVATHSSLSTAIAQRSSTPLRDISIRQNGSCDSHFGGVSKVTLKKAHQTRLSIGDESVVHATPPSTSYIVGGYNLRRRPQSPLIRKSKQTQETVEEFTEYVINGLAQQAEIRRKKIRKHIEDNLK